MSTIGQPERTTQYRVFTQGIMQKLLTGEIRPI